MARNLYFFDIEMKDVTPLIWAMNKKFSNVGVYVLRGAMMKDWDGVLGEFSAVLQFPDYFYFGGGIFGDCIHDLRWLGHEYCFIVMSNSDELFCSKEEDRDLFIEDIRDRMVDAGDDLSSTYNVKRNIYLLCQSKEKGGDVRHVYDLKKMLRPLFL